MLVSDPFFGVLLLCSCAVGTGSPLHYSVLHSHQSRMTSSPGLHSRVHSPSISNMAALRWVKAFNFFFFFLKKRSRKHIWWAGLVRGDAWCFQSQWAIMLNNSVHFYHNWAVLGMCLLVCWSMRYQQNKDPFIKHSTAWLVVKNVFFFSRSSSIPVVPTLQAWQLHRFQVRLDSTRLSTACPPGGTMACYPLPTAQSTKPCWCRRWSPSYPTSAWSSCGVRQSQLAVTGDYQDWTMLKTDAESVQAHD